MTIKHIFTVALLVFILATAGCSTNANTKETQGVATAGTAGVSSLVPGPTQVMPSDQAVDVQINEKDTSYKTITVLFNGGPGQNMVKKIDVTVTTSEGIVTTQNLKPIKQETLTFQGTTGTDRIVVTVSLLDGTTYTIRDQLVSFKTRA
jgi:hypothetical protein